MSFNDVLPRFWYHFRRCPESESWEMCAGVCTYVASRLSVKSSNQIGRSANGSSASFLSSVRDSWPNLLVVNSSLRSKKWTWRWAWCSPVSRDQSASNPNNSCGGEIEDEMLPELTDYPGTTRNTKLFVLQKYFLWHFGSCFGNQELPQFSWWLVCLVQFLKPKDQEQITHPYVVQHPEKWRQIL